MPITTPTLPRILRPGDSMQAEKAAVLLRRYFGLEGATRYTGARFESLTGGGDRAAVANVVTAEDLVSLSMLSIRVHGAAAQRLLEDQQFVAEVAEHLAQIPTDLDMVDASPDMFAAGSPADRLWYRLRQLPQFGETTTSKLMARKRPRLIPVYDSVIQQAFQMTGSGAQWTFWHDILQADHGELHKHLLSLRRRAGIPEHISALRVLDIVVWMQYRDPDEERDQAAPTGK